MSEHADKKSESLWIESIYRPGYKVARSTLKTIGRILSGEREEPAPKAVAAPEPTGGGAIPLTEVPALAEVGGVAKVETADRTTLGIARVGRNSFVGFRLDNEMLAEVEVKYDDQSATLRIGNATPAPPPPAEPPA
jgi:hypothetical protein